MSTELKLSEADFKGIFIILQRISTYSKYPLFLNGICMILFLCQPDLTLRKLCDNQQTRNQCRNSECQRRTGKFPWNGTNWYSFCNRQFKNNLKKKGKFFSGMEEPEMKIDEYSFYLTIIVLLDLLRLQKTKAEHMTMLNR